MRVSDPTWRDFLVHLRYGRVEPRHLKMLRTLLLKHSNIVSELPPSPVDLHTQPLTCSPISTTDFTTKPWADAALITPRHAVWTQWNEEASQKRCLEAGRMLFICPALDEIKGAPLTLKERYTLASRYKDTRKLHNKDLQETILLAIGMNVMVTNNLQTDLDIMNGARGVITDIILNQDEPPLEGESTVQLKFLPCFGETFPHMCRNPPASRRRSDSHPMCFLSHANQGGWEISYSYQDSVSDYRGGLLHQLLRARSNHPLRHH